jgi:SRSO17 transposase
LKQQLQQDVCHLLGDPVDGALILDESGIQEQGNMSVGVARQYCGALGKVDLCQVGVYLAYTNPHATTLMDFRLYLPESWIADTSRRTQCGVPQDVTFQTKAQLGLEMILSFKREGLPLGWVGFDAHYGEQPWFLERLTHEGIVYMAEIPANTRIFTVFPQTAVPPRRGKRGRLPKKAKPVPDSVPPLPVDQLAQRLPPSAWTRLRVRDTQRGELIADFAALRVWRAVLDLPLSEVWLLMRREVTGNLEMTYCFCNAPPSIPLERLATMQCRRYWVERTLENAKGEAGLDQYEVRGWMGWHHHMTITLLAMLFLLQLTMQFREKAPLLTIQDAREILETFLPRKTYSPTEFIALIEQKHRARLSARLSAQKKQKELLEHLKMEI